MRKSIFLFIATLMCVATANAQSMWWDSSKSAEGFGLGAQFGLNLTKFSHVDRWSDIKPGINVGVTLEKPIVNSLSVKTALLFTMKGTKGTNPNGFGGSITTTFAPYYLELPVLASYRVPVSDALRVQFDLGPYFAYGIGGRHKIEAEGRGAGDDVKDDVFPDFLNRFDMGLQFGPSVTWKDKFTAGLIFDTSLIDISNMGGKVGNFSFMINLGYKFTAF